MKRIVNFRFQCVSDAPNTGKVRGIDKQKGVGWDRGVVIIKTFLVVREKERTLYVNQAKYVQVQSQRAEQMGADGGRHDTIEQVEA